MAKPYGIVRFQLRIPQEIYRKIKVLAALRDVSTNTYLVTLAREEVHDMTLEELDSMINQPVADCG